MMLGNQSTRSVGLGMIQSEFIKVNDLFGLAVAFYTNLQGKSWLSEVRIGSNWLG